jgi:hypothetical protein
MRIARSYGPSSRNLNKPRSPSRGYWCLILADRLKEAPSRLATYVKHLAKSIPNQVLAFMKLYFPKAP